MLFRSGLGRVRVIVSGVDHGVVHEAFLQDTPDHRILGVTMTLTERFAPRPVLLVSKDTNLRMKAKSLGLRAQDYTSDKVESFDKLYTGKRVIEGIATDGIDQFYSSGGVRPIADVPFVPHPIANENFVLRNGSKSALATYRATDRKIGRAHV